MKSSWLLFLLVLWAGGVSAADLTGDEILTKSENAYAALKSYVGTTTVKSNAVINDMHIAQTAMAKIVFSRPGKIRIEGKDTSGQAFTIVSDGKGTWSSWAIKNKGAFERSQSVEMAIAGMTGVAAGAPTQIPAALMKLNWGYPFVRAKDSKLEGREKIRGADCYRVVSKTPAGRTRYWVDSRNFLLRQMKEEQDENELAELQRKVEEEAGKTLREQGIEMPKFAMKSRETLHSFAIEKINVSIDPKLFQDPTKSKGR